MNKKLEFDLSVETNALFCPNPSAWYDKAYLGAIDPANFNVIPGVKNSTKVYSNSFPSVLQALDCTFAATSSSLDAVTVDVNPIKVNVSICKSTIETSFVVAQMKQGSQNYNVAEFMGHYWDTLQKEVSQEISEIQWKGSTTNGAYSGTTAYLSLVDGYEKLLLANASVVDVTLTATTVANVISLMTSVLSAAPAAVKAKTSGAKFYVSSTVAVAYRIASALGNTAAYITGEMPMSFAGYEVIECPGMTSGKMVFTRPGNLVYALDGFEDSSNLVAIDEFKTTGIPNIKTVALFTLGFQILNPSEIVYFN